MHPLVSHSCSQCTVTIAEKEKKSSAYATAKLDKLSDEKQSKIKKFARDFFTKAVHKMEKKKATRSSSSPTKASSSTMDPRRASLSTDTGSNSTTLLRTDATPPSPADDDAHPGGEDVDVKDLMDQMFGEDVDEEETLKAEQTPDGDMDIDGDQLKLGTLENTPVGDPSDREVSESRPRDVKMEVESVAPSPQLL